MNKLHNTSASIGYIEGQFSITRQLTPQHAERYLALCAELSYKGDEYLLQYIETTFSELG